MLIGSSEIDLRPFCRTETLAVGFGLKVYAKFDATVIEYDVASVFPSNVVDFLMFPSSRLYGQLGLL